MAAAVVAALQFGFGAHDAAEASDVQSWQRSVAQHVGKMQVYPRAAMSREIEGRARVQVSIDRSGTVTGYDVVEGTGHDLLDAEVVRLMGRIDPLPAPPAALGDDSLTFVLPLTWVLN
ncbi:MAG: energy transducer TonB [Sphingomonadales bacterium]